MDLNSLGEIAFPASTNSKNDLMGHTHSGIPKTPQLSGKVAIIGVSPTFTANVTI